MPQEIPAIQEHSELHELHTPWLNSNKKVTLQDNISTVQSSVVGVTRKSITGATSIFKNWILCSVHLQELE